MRGGTVRSQQVNSFEKWNWIIYGSTWVNMWPSYFVNSRQLFSLSKGGNSTHSRGDDLLFHDVPSLVLKHQRQLSQLLRTCKRFSQARAEQVPLEKKGFDGVLRNSQQIEHKRADFSGVCPGTGQQTNRPALNHHLRHCWPAWTAM